MTGVFLVEKKSSRKVRELGKSTSRGSDGIGVISATDIGVCIERGRRFFDSPIGMKECLRLVDALDDFRHDELGECHVFDVSGIRPDRETHHLIAFAVFDTLIRHGVAIIAVADLHGIVFESEECALERIRGDEEIIPPELYTDILLGDQTTYGESIVGFYGKDDRTPFGFHD